jgi:hypothetical protein
MKNVEQDLKFGNYFRDVNLVLKKFVDSLAEDIAAQSARIDGDVPQVTLAAYWEHLSSLDTWHSVRNTVIALFVESLSEKCPVAMTYLAKKISVALLECRGE